MGWEQEFTLSNKLPGDADAARWLSLHLSGLRKELRTVVIMVRIITEATIFTRPFFARLFALGFMCILPFNAQNWKHRDLNPACLFFSTGGTFSGVGLGGWTSDQSLREGSWGLWRSAKPRRGLGTLRHLEVGGE